MTYKPYHGSFNPKNVIKVDTQIFFLINGSHTFFLDQLMFLVSQKTVWVPLYLCLLFVVWRNYSWRGVLTVLVMVGLGMLITDWANAHLLRPWIGRLRPNNPDNPIAHAVHIVNERRGAGCGFPSAHAANIWLLTLLMVHWFRNRVMSTSMIVVALLVCYSRIYLGFHYPGDVLGGFILACITTWILTWAHERYFDFKPLRSPQKTWVAAIMVAMTIVIFITLAMATAMRMSE